MKPVRLTGLFTLLLLACSACGQFQSSPVSMTEQPAAIITPPQPTAVPITPSPSAGQMRADAAGIEQVWAPAGSFLMGTTEEESKDVLAANPPMFVRNELSSEMPAHEVTLSKGFWIDRYEVSNAAFRAFVDAGGYQDQQYWSEGGWKWLQDRGKITPACSGAPDPVLDKLPCVHVNWYEAEAYARWRGGRLPSEAEWEYTARGPNANIYPWGSSFDPAKANVIPSPGLQPVDSYPNGASWVGAYNMAGNAMEWVQDWLDTKYYEQDAAVDPQGPVKGVVKVEKGGWWGSNPFVARSAYRHFEDPPTYGDNHIGFRVVSTGID